MKMDSVGEMRIEWKTLKQVSAGGKKTPVATGPRERDASRGTGRPSFRVVQGQWHSSYIRLLGFSFLFLISFEMFLAVHPHLGGIHPAV